MKEKTQQQDTSSKPDFGDLSNMERLFSMQLSPEFQTAAPPPHPPLLPSPQLRPLRGSEAMGSNLYDSLQAAAAAANQPVSPGQLSRLFEAVVSPQLQPLSPQMAAALRNGLSNGDLFLPGVSPNLRWLSNNGGSYLAGGFQMTPPGTKALSPHSSSSPHSSTKSLSPRSCALQESPRVAKVPVRPHRSMAAMAAAKRRHSAPMILPCQVVNLQTNELAPQPGCPDLLIPSKAYSETGNGDSTGHQTKRAKATPPILAAKSSNVSSASSPTNSTGSIFSTILPGGVTLDSAPWMADFARHRLAYLKDFKELDFGNITVIEMKQLLRRYGLARTGKKVDLEDRIRQVAAFLEEQIKREQKLADKEGKTETPEVVLDPSIFINA